MTETKDKKPRKFSLRNVSLKKLNHKYDFLMSHDESGRPMLNFRLNLLNLILVIIGLALLLIIITTFIIAFTPLREYIPGYTDTNLNREVYLLNLRADSLSREMHKKDIYFENLQKIVEGYDFAADSALASINIYEPLPKGVTDTITLKKSVQDSLLRAEFEAQSQYNLFGDNPAAQAKRQAKNFLVTVSTLPPKATKSLMPPLMARWCSPHGASTMAIALGFSMKTVISRSTSTMQLC